MTVRLVLALLATLQLVGCGCAGIEKFTTPIPDDGTFAARAPTAEEVVRCDAAAAYAAAHHGRSIVMLQDNQVVCERQLNGNTEPTPGPLWSGTKSFWCALHASLVQSGDVATDEKLSDTLASFRTPKKRDMTVRHLLSFTSGAQKNQLDLTLDGFKAPKDQRIADRYARALDLRMVSAPGTHFEYGSMHLFMYGAFVKAKLGKEPLALLQERIFAPIGFRFAGWNTDRQGQAALPYGAWTTAREWAKFMVLLKDRGQWQGRQLFDEATFDQSLQGSDAMPAYGLTLWLNAPVSQEKLDALRVRFPKSDGDSGLIWAGGPSDLYMAAGAMNQRGYVLPSKNLIIIHTGDRDDGFNDGDFLARAVNGAARAGEGKAGTNHGDDVESP